MVQSEGQVLVRGQPLYVNLSEYLGVAPGDLGILFLNLSIFGKPPGFWYNFKVFMIYWQQ